MEPRQQLTPLILPSRSGGRPQPARLLTTLLALLVMLGAAPLVAAQPTIVSTEVGELPTTGGMRPGPVGMSPPPVARVQGAPPVAIQVDQASIDAEIEPLEIINGVMQNPTGPWVVSWYQETARPGESGNIVMAGHIDYWNVGPAVFYELEDLQEGDQVRVIDDEGDVFTYEVEWLEIVEVTELTSGRIQELVGPTDGEALTLITCGGEFDYVNGEYLSRTVVRALPVNA